VLSHVHTLRNRTRRSVPDGCAMAARWLRDGCAMAARWLRDGCVMRRVM